MNDDGKPNVAPSILQWSLRSFLVVVTLIAVILGFYWRRVHNQARFVSLARAAGALVIYDHQMSGLGNYKVPYKPSPHPHKWLVDLIGPDALYGVEAVDFISCGEPLNAELHAAVCDCPALKEIWLRPGEPDEFVERLKKALPSAHVLYRPAFSDEEWAEYHRTHPPD